MHEYGYCHGSRSGHWTQEKNLVSWVQTKFPAFPPYNPHPNLGMKQSE